MSRSAGKEGRETRYVELPWPGTCALHARAIVACALAWHARTLVFSLMSQYPCLACARPSYACFVMGSASLRVACCDAISCLPVVVVAWAVFQRVCVCVCARVCVCVCVCVCSERFRDTRCVPQLLMDEVQGRLWRYADTPTQTHAHTHAPCFLHCATRPVWRLSASKAQMCVSLCVRACSMQWVRPRVSVTSGCQTAAPRQ